MKLLALKSYNWTVKCDSLSQVSSLTKLLSHQADTRNIRTTNKIDFEAKKILGIY